MLLSSLQRIAATCGRPSLGLSQFGTGSTSVAAAAAAVVSSSSSSALWLRAYSDEASGSDKPAEPAAVAASDAAAEGGEVAAGAEEQPAVPEALIDFEDGSVVPPELYSKRQLAWMGLGEEGKYKHFLPALSRKELGSFADEYVAEEFELEQELYPEVPDVPLYDLREVVPEMVEPRSDLFERLRRLKTEQHPDMPIDQFVQEVVGINVAEEQPPAKRPGAQKIIRWEIRHTYAVGTTEGHPSNRKVKAWVYLRDLQREYGLTDSALQHIAAICGPRYDPNKGQLKLTSDRYPHREANRAHIMQIIGDLVAEGHRRHPAAAEAPRQQQQAAVAQ